MVSTKIECCVDAAFGGIYTKDNIDDPNSPSPKQIFLSTTEAEYIALSTAAREVLQMRTLISEIVPVMNIAVAEPDIKCTIFEDNKEAEELAKVKK
eukprot:11860966-Ditylum_brightwellii.AAC.1